jgi:hypothetical protein
MASECTAAEKVIDKVTGALEKLVDMRMLVLGISLLLYADIWFIQSNVDPSVLTFEDGIAILRRTSITVFVMFMLSYSLLMAVAFPALRFIYGRLWLVIRPNSYMSENRNIEARRLSDWSVGVVLFSIWDSATGYFGPAHSYQGLVLYLSDFLSRDGVTVTVFRVSAGFFMMFCLALAFDRDM